MSVLSQGAAHVRVFVRVHVCACVFIRVCALACVYAVPAPGGPVFTAPAAVKRPGSLAPDDASSTRGSVTRRAPLFNVDVDVGGGQRKRIVVRSGDVAAALAQVRG